MSSLQTSKFPAAARRATVVAMAAALVFSGGPVATYAQAPIASEFVVNTTTTLDQTTPEIATDLDGAFVAVWVSDGQDGSGDGIFAQFFDEDGDEVGLELQVNDTTAGDQTDPAVSMSDDEKYAVAWVGPDANLTGIFLRIFGDDRGAVTDIAVNTTTVGEQKNPAVAFAEDDVILVVWESPDADGAGIVGRLFDEEGLPLSPEFAVPASPQGSQTRPSVDDVDEDGTFIVAWEGVDASGRGIFARRVDDQGLLLGSEIAVNATTSGNQTAPKVGVESNDDALEDNGFMVAWEGPDTGGTGIYAQFFDESGATVGPEQQVNEVDAGNQFDPDISIDDDGDIIVTWTDEDPNGVPFASEDTASRGNPILIRGRRLIGGSQLRGGLQLSGGSSDPAFTVATGVLTGSAVAVEAGGDFVAIWRNVSDGNGSGIFGRRFGLNAIFADDFESGDTSEWSSVTP